MLSGGNVGIGTTNTGTAALAVMSGNVGIGTTNPTKRLHVYTTAAADGLAIDGNNDPALALLNSGTQVATIGVATAVNAWMTGASINDLVIKSNSSNNIHFGNTATNEIMSLLNNGNVGIGSAAPTAALNLKAGTAAAGTAPLKFTSGTNLTTAEAGAMEYDGTKLYYTDSGATRRTLATTNSAESFTGDITMGGAGTGLAVTNNATVGGTLGVTGDATLSGAGTGLAVTNNATVGGTLGVTGDATLSGAGTGLAVTNNATVGGTLGVTGATTLSSTLGVTGDATLSGAGTGLAVTNNETVGGTLIVTGVTTLNGGGTGLAVANSETVGGTLTVTGATSLNGGATIAAGQNLTMTSGAGVFTQTYTGTTTPAKALTANSVTTSSAESITANGLTSGNIMSLSSSSTAATPGNTGLNIAISGANAAATTRYGLQSAVTATGGLSTNVGGYFSASGGTSNYGLLVASGNVGIGTTAPTAALGLKAGTTAAGTAPLKFTSGANLTTPEAGAMEYDGTNLYYTDSGATRRTLATTNSADNFSGDITMSGAGTGLAVTNNETVGETRAVTGATTLSSTLGVTGATSLNGGATIAANQNLTMTSGTGSFTQTYTGTTTPAKALTANSVTTSSAESITANGLTSGNIMSLSSSSTAATPGNTGLNIAISGANAAATTRYGLQSAVTATGGLSTNVGGYFSASGGTNNYGLIVASGNVGIGSTSPSQALDVVGAGRVSTALMTPSIRPITDGTSAIQITNAAGGTNIVNIDSTNSRVGIGSATPGYALDVNGTVRATGFLTGTGTANWNGEALTNINNLEVGTTSASGADLNFGGSLSRVIQVDRNSGGTNGGNLSIDAGGAMSGGPNYNGGNLILSSGIATGSGSSIIQFNTAGGGGSGAADNLPTTKMTILGSGNVGIGTTLPTSPLEIFGNGKNIRLDNAIATTPGFLELNNNGSLLLSANVDSANTVFDSSKPQWRFALTPQTTDDFSIQRSPAGAGYAPSYLFWIASSGNVGIGTTNPSQSLDVNARARGRVPGRRYIRGHAEDGARSLMARGGSSRRCVATRSFDRCQQCDGRVSTSPARRRGRSAGGDRRRGRARTTANEALAYRRIVSAYATDGGTTLASAPADTMRRFWSSAAGARR